MYGEVTYIFLIDVSGSTIKLTGNCGDRGRDSMEGKVLDCEVSALEDIQTELLKSGNVDLLGLAWFGTVGGRIDAMMMPWDQTTGRRDSVFIEFARKMVAGGLTNYEAGVEQACEIARNPANTNSHTVVVMVSDGKPNRGQSVKNLVQNNCGGATFQTFAITNMADCYAIDKGSLGPTDNPDMLYNISEYTGGTCSQVPNVNDLPHLLVTLEKTTWDGVRVLLNDTEVFEAKIKYADMPGFEGPKDTTYDGTVAVGPGEWDLCVEALASTSGVTERKKECTKVNVLTIDTDTPELTRRSILNEYTASFNVNLISLGPKGGCNTDVTGRNIVVKFCNGTLVTELVTDANGSVKYEYTHNDPDRTTRIDCFMSCFTDPHGNEACSETIVEWQVSDVPLMLLYPPAHACSHSHFIAFICRRTYRIIQVWLHQMHLLARPAIIHLVCRHHHLQIFPHVRQVLFQAHSQVFQSPQLAPQVLYRRRLHHHLHQHCLLVLQVLYPVAHQVFRFPQL